MFVGSIMLATYSLIEEKQIAIRFVQKELVGAQYLEALRGVYVIITDDAGLQGAGKRTSEALAAVESGAPGLPSTAKLTRALATTVRRLSSEAFGSGRQALVVEALAKARDLAAQIGDESNLALDPDLDSYYVQNIVVKGVPTLLSEFGELDSLMRTAS